VHHQTYIEVINASTAPHHVLIYSTSALTPSYVYIPSLDTNFAKLSSLPYLPIKHLLGEIIVQIIQILPIFKSLFIKWLFKFSSCLSFKKIEKNKQTKQNGGSQFLLLFFFFFKKMKNNSSLTEKRSRD
jgi:hypothetical protein